MSQPHDGSLENIYSGGETFNNKVEKEFQRSLEDLARSTGVPAGALKDEVWRAFNEDKNFMSTTLNEYAESKNYSIRG